MNAFLKILFQMTLVVSLLVPALGLALDVTPMSRNFESEKQILSSYRAQLELMDPRDMRGLFLQVYEQVSLEVEKMLAQHEFKNEAWIRNLMIQYANLYRESFVLSELNPQALPSSWKLAFVSPQVAQKTPAFQLLTAINAHVNRDLPYALMRVQTDFKNPSMKKDFEHISASFNRRMPNLWQVLKQYDSCVRGSLEKFLAIETIQWALGVTRNRAWHRGEVLSQITNTLDFDQEVLSLESYALGQFRKIKVSPATIIDQGLCEIEQEIKN